MNELFGSLPPTNEVWGKVIFSQASVCPQWGRGVPDRDHPIQRFPRTVKSGRYASYWNAFLLSFLLFDIWSSVAELLLSSEVFQKKSPNKETRWLYARLIKSHIHAKSRENWFNGNETFLKSFIKCLMRLFC